MSTIIRLLYTLLITLVSPIFLYGLYKGKPNKPKFGSRWKEHFGITPPLKDSSNQPIWIHTVSVGETIAATPFIRALKQKYPNTPLVITTTTSTGAEQAEKLSDIAEHRYMPIDLPFAIKSFIKSINPKMMLIMETELWPNTIHHVSKSAIPITVINARLSEKSARGYAKIRPIFDLLTKGITRILCQYQDDADRFEKLGVPIDKLAVTGSLKFDITIPNEVITAGDQLRTKLGKDRPIWIAASTHKGEDEQVLAAHKCLLKSHPDALLILVPRHPERFDDVYQLTLNSKFNTIRRTQKSNNENLSKIQVYLGDTMGEMLILMQASDICFMGGSLLGDKVGGHNPLEPAALGKPIIIGPSFYNFKEAVELLEKNKLLSIQEANNLIENIAQLLPNKINESININSNQFLDKNKGSIKRTLESINLI